MSTRIIQNIGATFGSAILATVVSNSMSGEAATASTISGAYHAGFMVCTRRPRVFLHLLV
ncbi:hypothetical protein [Desulfosporosinus youngiae]|uniref:hypothetical protein n=1 Tax=Desulfosporosinus youngiae TaxID=339862 RepID=UPI0002FB14A4|nr:hypothetical protein [Desulfosporosinus youngiae]